MSGRYPLTIHISQEMADKIDRPVDPAVISSRPGGGNTTQSFLKGDIIADQLNAVFGPLGWGVEARIHQMDDWDETKSVTRNNQRTDVSMHMVQVVSDVKLTIKKTTPDGTDTVFVQPGIGYGEAEEGKSRKEAFGMAVKGAATDGLKRCATLVGKAFGMMMASNGSQEDIEYAHNGKQQNLRRAQDLRRNQGGRGEGQRQIADNRGQGDRQRQIADGRGSSGRGQDDRQAAGGRTQEDRQPQRQERQRDDGQRAAERDQGERDQGRGRGGDDRAQQDRGRQDDRQEDRSRDNAADAGQQRRDERPVEQDGGKPKDEAPVRGAEKDGAKDSATKQGGAKRQADTNYALDSLPITRQDMTDFGATLLERVRELKQHSDRAGLVRQHLNTIKNLDSAIRKRVIDRLRELEVDVDKL